MPRALSLFVSVICVGLLVGCTTPTPTPTQSPAPTTAVVTPTPTPSATSTPEPPVSTFALVCVPPSDDVLSWLNDNGFPNLNTNNTTMVDVGVGTQPDSDWAVVAALLHDIQESGSPPVPFVQAWLTDLSSGSTRWIGLGQFDAIHGTRYSFESTNWQGDRLARGKAALSMAVTRLMPQVPTS